MVGLVVWLSITVIIKNNKSGRGLQVNINLENALLPPVYIRNGKECYLDPIRKMLIYVTPEETVRQKVISYLIKFLGVPTEMIAVEEHISHYGIQSKRRADIVIHYVGDTEDILLPLAVIECKAPNVFLSERTSNQMLDYADLLGCEYAVMVNGNNCFSYKYSEVADEYIEIERLPSYIEMSKGVFEEIEKKELPPRVTFEQMEGKLKESLQYKMDFNPWEYDISPQTPFELAHAAFNLSECLLDTRIKIPTGKYQKFTLLEDYGVRMLTYGNSSGGTFYGPYRTFLIEYNGSTEFVSLNVTTYWKSTNPDKVKTCLCVAIDNEKTTHHALQLVIDDNVTVEGDIVKFYHHGKIAVGNKGSGKIDELRLFVNDLCPQIISGKNFYLGRLENNRLWTLEDEDVINLLENLITYSLARDEYRKSVKANAIR